MSKAHARKKKQAVDPGLEKEWDDLVEVASLLGVQVRRERGMFKSGSCTVDDQEMIIINRRLTIEGQIQVLIRELSHCDMESVFLRPEIREKIERGRVE